MVPLITYPISAHNGQNLCSFSDQNDSKIIPFGTAHTYIAYVGEYTPPLGCGVSALIAVPLILPNWSTLYVRIISVKSWTYSFVPIEQSPVYFMQSCLAVCRLGFLTAVYRAIIPTSRGYSSTNKCLRGLFTIILRVKLISGARFSQFCFPYLL